MTRFTLSSARVRASKYAVFFIVLGTSFFWSPSASADNVWQTTNGNVVGNTVQFDWRGGSATYVTDVSDGSTVSVIVNNTIANCIGSCTPIPDEWTVSINGQTFSGNTIEVITVGTQVSGQVTVVVTGRDIGFWGGWYGPVFSAPVIASPILMPVVETPTVVDEPVVETVTPVVPTDTETVPGNTDTSTSVLETETVVETNTATSETPSIPQEPAPSVPAPPPAVEPEPTPAPVPIPQPEPQPEPVPTPPDPAPEPPAPAEEPPVAEEPPPVEEPAPPAVEEEPPLPPVEEEPPAPAPEPLPEPIVEPEPELPPDIAPEPPSINDVNLESLAPSTPVQLDNGVVVTAEVAIAVALLQDPAELLQELFTDPAAAFAALGSVGADLPPEVRERAEEVVIASVIVGNIATSAAATAAAGAAYRRKP